MNDSKTVFQSASANLELLLRQYKNQYPRNLGALLRNSLPILLIIVSVFILNKTENKNVEYVSGKLIL